MSKTEISCAFVGCLNTFIPRHHRHRYCSDERCIELRAELKKSQISSKVKPILKKNNLILNKGFCSGQKLIIRCNARGINGHCLSEFPIVFEKKQGVYPKFCAEHRNEYKRVRFQTVRKECLK